MLKFDTDITLKIGGEDFRMMGSSEMISANTFRFTMTSPFEGLTVTKTFDDSEVTDMDAIFALVEQNIVQVCINELIQRSQAHD